jgi:phosphoenolpyruvate---glycerone phosphotransferase subunit DhaL
LIVVALLHVSKTTAGKRELSWGEVGTLLDGALQAMMNRGKASLGDKTVLDPIHAVARAMSGKQLPADLAGAAMGAGRLCLVEFRDRPCRVGRARMFADKSVGRDDPGQLAFVAMLEAVCGTNSNE